MGRLLFSNTQNLRHPLGGGQQGFALVSTMILIPLLLTLTFSLAMVFYILQNKSLAQSMCVQEAVRLQENLRKPLRELLRMNRQATILRAKREAADESLASATSSGVPYAIALAKAVQTAVIVEQIAFHARQLAWLAQAAELRSQGERTLQNRALRLHVEEFTSRTYYYRSLAVEPTPSDSLSPDYQPVPFFTTAQQQRFRYQVDLTYAWPTFKDNLAWRQPTECSATLEGEEQQWKVRILAVKAPLSF